MPLRKLFLILVIFSATVRAADEPAPREWTIDGVKREALVYAPPAAHDQPSPVIFAFHGHGGTMQIVARKWKYETLWPQAIVVYPQGLNTPGRLTDKEGKFPGWQAAPGEQDDRDLKFFDRILASLKKDYRVDESRIYVTGHSNGGTFVYVLWAARNDVFAAFAPASSSLSLTNVTVEKNAAEQKSWAPKPVLHIAGENDPLVKFQWQKLTIDTLRRINQCTDGQPWERNCTLYPSKIGAPVVALIHPGMHALPNSALPVIVKFFKEHPKPSTRSAK